MPAASAMSAMFTRLKPYRSNAEHAAVRIWPFFWFRCSGDSAYRDSAQAYVKFMERAGLAPFVAERRGEDDRQGRAGPQAEGALSHQRGVRLAQLTRRLLSDRAFDALMLLGSRPARKAS